MKNTEEPVCAALNAAGIPYEITYHPAVHSIRELQSLGLEKSCLIAKNLFLRDDRRERYFILTLRQDKSVHLKELRSILHCRPLSFASEEELQSLLCCNAGAVTPLGIIHDREHKVEVVLDTDILAFPLVGVHPDSNEATVWLSPEYLQQFIHQHGNRIHHVSV